MTELKIQQCRLDGRYDILSCLGRGSYAEIYVARDRAARAGAPEMVVIKALNVQLQGNPDADLERTLVENFQNEALALDRVRHPHIINRLGHGTAIDLTGVAFHYLVFEYMPGGDLAARYRQQPFTLERTLYYLKQVCSGLSYAHERGVIHRDIKPQNLLLTADARIVKIADFGVAKIEATEGEITRVGTNIYAAPEHNPLVHTGPLDASLQDGSIKAGLTPAADIYSLAKTTYALLAGAPPKQFPHRPITELPDFIAREAWATELLRVLERATQDAPLKRYQKVEEFWEDLSKAARILATDNGTKLIAEDEKETVKLSSVSPNLQAATVPPRPRFDSTRSLKGKEAPDNAPHNARIVVPVAGRNEVEKKRSFFSFKKSHVPNARTPAQTPHGESGAFSNRSWIRILIVVICISAFAGLLTATYEAFHRRTETNANSAPPPDSSIVGREGRIRIDVKLRPDPSTNNPEVGVAEKDSRVRVLNIGGRNNNWCEILVLEHGREKDDPYAKDRGWVTRRFIIFD